MTFLKGPGLTLGPFGSIGFTGVTELLFSLTSKVKLTSDDCSFFVCRLITTTYLPGFK